MTSRTFASLAFPAVLFAALSFSPAWAQTMINTSDPGVARGTLLDKPTVRVLRVELQPGAVRVVHKHDDVKFHLFMPITGSIELTMGSTKTVAPPGQAYFMEKGTPHGFRNTGTTHAAVFEVFIREVPASAAKNDSDSAERDALALAQVLAALK